MARVPAVTVESSQRFAITAVDRAASLKGVFGSIFAIHNARRAGGEGHATLALAEAPPHR